MQKFDQSCPYSGDLVLQVGKAAIPFFRTSPAPAAEEMFRAQSPASRASAQNGLRPAATISEAQTESRQLQEHSGNKITTSCSWTVGNAM